MKKPVRICLLIVLTLSILLKPISVYPQTYTITPTLQSYIDRGGGLLNQIYYLGQAALANTINQIDNTELLRLIEFNSSEVSMLEAEVLGYIASLVPNTMESRNATILHIALHHFQMALGELIFFINALTDIDRFNALQRYFYDINTALENINQLRQQPFA